MTLTEFLIKYNGKWVEVAGSVNAKNQCVDLANAFIRDVLGLPIIEWTNAVDFPSKAGDAYEWIKNTPTGIPQEGDLMIFGGKYGHISIFLEGNVNTFKSFDQNFPLGSDSHVQGHGYSNVLGWLRKKGGIIKEPSIEADMEINDQTKIDLGAKLGIMQVDQIRSSLLDGQRDFKDVTAKYKELLEKPAPGMSEEQFLGLGDMIKKTVSNQSEATNASIKINRDLLNTISNLQNEDRTDLGTIKVKIQATLDQMEEFKGVLASQTSKITDAVKDAVKLSVIDIGAEIKTAVQAAMNMFTNGGTPVRKKTIMELLKSLLQKWKTLNAKE